MKKIVALAVVAAAASPAHALDFGERIQRQLEVRSSTYFGFVRPLAASSTDTIARQDGQSAADLVILARGLRAEIVTRQAAHKADMFALWPNDSNPTHTIWCVEGGTEDLGTTLPGSTVAKLNPSVQAIDASGNVTTLVRGMTRCDGIRRTPWGTILANEENGLPFATLAEQGAAWEIIDPLAIENHTVTDRAAGTVVDASGAPSANVVKRTALPLMAWEGMGVTDQGVVIAGDELRPGDYNSDGSSISIGYSGDEPDVDGGAMYKFVPAVPYDASSGNISDPADSPLASGSVYALRISCREGTSSAFNVNYGQGCEVGNGSWVPVSAANARIDANAAQATGFYRPEDLHLDPTYSGTGVRFCWTNTGREKASHFGEVMCGIDDSPLLAEESTASVVINRFIEGDSELNSVDNLAFQPSTGNVYVIEDHPNGDIWACLPDGGDRDIKSDGCVRAISVRDPSAEPSGFGFSADGKTAWLSIQHSDDALCTAGTDCADADGYATDDILKITGWRK